MGIIPRKIMCPKNILHYQFIDKDEDLLVDEWGVVVDGPPETLDWAIFEDGLLDSKKVTCKNCGSKVIEATPLVDMLFTRLPATKPDVWGIGAEDLITILQNNLFQKDDDIVREIIETILYEFYIPLRTKESRTVKDLLRQYKIFSKL